MSACTGRGGSQVGYICFRRCGARYLFLYLLACGHQPLQHLDSTILRSAPQHLAQPAEIPTALKLLHVYVTAYLYESTAVSYGDTIEALLRIRSVPHKSLRPTDYKTTADGLLSTSAHTVVLSCIKIHKGMRVSIDFVIHEALARIPACSCKLQMCRLSSLSNFTTSIVHLRVRIVARTSCLNIYC